MEKIKKGDLLVCVDPGPNFLTAEKEYVATSEENWERGNPLVEVVDDSNVPVLYLSRRFRKKDIPQPVHEKYSPKLTAPLDLIKSIAEANPAFKAEAERIWPDAFPVPVPEIKLRKANSGFGKDVVIVDANHPCGDGGHWAVLVCEGQIQLCIEYDWKIEGDKLIPTRKSNDTENKTGV